MSVSKATPGFSTYWVVEYRRFDDTALSLLCRCAGEVVCEGIKCGICIHHAMADGSSGESMVGRWKAACDGEQADVLLSMLEGCRGGLEVDGLTSEETTAGFVVACKTGHVGLLQRLLIFSDHRQVDVHVAFRGTAEYGFLLACRYGHAEVVRELLLLGGAREVDVHVEHEWNPELGFRVACRYGHLDVVKELLSLSGHREVDVHAAFKGSPEAAFRVACENGHLAIVRELLALSGHREVDVHAGWDEQLEAGFRLACANGHVAVVRELLALKGHRAIPPQFRHASQVVQAVKDTIWYGTCTGQGRAAMLLLRASRAAQPRLWPQAG